MLDKCFFCKDIENIKNNKKNPFFLLQLNSGYVSIGHNQYYKGYCLFISNIHASDLHELDRELRNKFLIDMALVEEVIYVTFKPKKINIELLGNSHPHLHWHIIPRYENDTLPKIPVWNNPEFLINKTRPSRYELNTLKKMLLEGFNKYQKGSGFNKS